MSKVISISNHKGGVGKTTSAINIAASIARRDKKVLLIDLDPQSNLTQGFGVKNIQFNIYDYLRGEKNIIPLEVKKNIYIIPSSLDLSAAEIELSSEPGREYILKDVILKLKDKYDYIIIDCPPSLGLLTINALTASNKVIIPLQAEFFPVKGLAKLNEVIEKIKNRINQDIEIGCVFLTQYDQRKILHREIAEMIKNFYQEKLFESTISTNIALAEAQSLGKDIFMHNKSSKGAIDYEQLCNELFEKGVL
ncbi:MAG: Sporulation initiation inhibitor protein Soj [Holosporales bacterium]